MKERRVDAEKWSEVLGMPYVQRCWENYSFGGGWGLYNGLKSLTRANKNIVSTNINSSTISTLLYNISKRRWRKYASFYTGLFVFCLKDNHDFIEFVEDNELSHPYSLKGCLEEHKLPLSCREKAEEVWNSDFSFEEFLRVVNGFDNLFFDLQSAIDVYHLQGDAGIFNILCQIFWRGSRRKVFSVVLCPELPIIYDIEVSDFVSGVSFPCVVSPFSDNMRYEIIDDGWFVIDDNDKILDCVGVGQFNVWDEPLSVRLDFVGRGGLSSGLVCWCWGDIVKAVGQYGGDVIVRSLSEKFLNSKWHKFGLNGKIAVMEQNGELYSRRNRKNPVKNMKLQENKEKGRKAIIMNLAGKKIEKTTEKEVVFSKSELEDWFELSELCKKELRK